MAGAAPECTAERRAAVLPWPDTGEEDVVPVAGDEDSVMLELAGKVDGGEKPVADIAGQYQRVARVLRLITYRGSRLPK